MSSNTTRSSSFAETQAMYPSSEKNGMTSFDSRFELVRLIGRGGMGEVWLAKQRSLQREVAIKRLRADADALMRDRLRREAMALASMNHPHIVRVIDYGEAADSSPYLVMEFVAGETLEHHLNHQGSFDCAEAIHAIIPLLNGLSVAHQMGVIHRDIKPSNVILSHGPTPLSKAGMHLKLIDFGIALRTQIMDPRLTGNHFVGTPAYIAPEQLQRGQTDERTDVWGAALTLYEMIAGAPAFGFDDIPSVLNRVLHTEAPYPKNASGLSRELWSVLQKALEKDPSRRFSSVTQFVQALEACAIPSTVKPPSVQARVPMHSEPPPVNFDQLLRERFGNNF